MVLNIILDQNCIMNFLYFVFTRYLILYFLCISDLHAMPLVSTGGPLVRFGEDDTAARFD